jgi:hypothetical protein
VDYTIFKLGPKDIFYSIFCGWYLWHAEHLINVCLLILKEEGKVNFKVYCNVLEHYDI